MDADSDGVPDAEDAFPNDANESADSDGDGVGNNADAHPDDPNQYLQGDVVAGQAIWEAQCSGCHGDFVNDGVLPTMNVDPSNFVQDMPNGLVQYIHETMPLTDPTACEDQCAADVAEYVKVLPEAPAPEPAPVVLGDAVAGKALYESSTQNCALCHGASGEGGALGGPVVTAAWSDHTTLADVIAKTMPFGAPDKCGQDCADDIAAYLITLPRVE